MQRSLLSMLVLSALAGCASGAAVSADGHLPVRSVVLYRSGVGYFERTGSFHGDALTFQVKQREVGDFLASLTTVAHTGGGVVSVAFEPPVHVEGDDAQADPGEQPVDVTLRFGSAGTHDMSVSYVVGSPVWRPSYRVVFEGADDEALLQAWAVVQNASGEDFEDVKLSLTTGAPIAFRSDLGTPIVPERPLVTDTGEVVQAVPLGETVISQAGAAPDMARPPPPLAAAAPEREAAEEEAMSDWDGGDDAVQQKKSARARSEHGAGTGAPGPMLSLLEQSVRARASAVVVTESVTRYDLAEPVTIPDGGSSMVAIVSARVPGEQAHLYAPEPGVALSRSHPFAVARISNTTGAVLEKGPISVLSRGAFLGQGVLDTLPREAQAFVPFALDKSVVVEPSAQHREQEGRLVRIQRGLVTVQRFSQRETLYQVRNGGAAPIKLYVRHPRWPEAELVGPAEGTELAPDKALLPLRVEPKKRAELTVVERTPVELDLTIMDPRAAQAIALWLSGPAAREPMAGELKRALALRSELAALDERIAVAEREQNELQRGSNEARKNLKAIEKLPRAKDLRDRLYERLKQLDARGAALVTQLVEARTRRAELEVRLNEALEAVSLSPPAPP